MLTRRDALKLLLASPALRLTPVAAAPAPFWYAVDTPLIVVWDTPPSAALLAQLDEWVAERYGKDILC